MEDSIVAISAISVVDARTTQVLATPKGRFVPGRCLVESVHFCTTETPRKIRGIEGCIMWQTRSGSVYEAMGLSDRAPARL